MRLSVRNWLIRGFILAGVAILIALGWVANSWVSPERIREQVIATLCEQFDDVDVHVGSAHMRILGGIAVRDIKLTRRGSPGNEPFFTAPSAIVYHDKEQLNRGRLVIRKVDLDDPVLHLERTSEGHWNLTDMMKPGPADRPVPTFLASGATITIVDRSQEAIPELLLTEARFTLLNDPLPILTITADANAQGFGPIQVRTRINRLSRHVSLGVELPEFPLGDAAPMIVEKFAPQLLGRLGKITATASVKADLTYVPGITPTWRHDVRVEINDGRLEHPDLPWPIEKIAARLREVDGQLKVDEATATIGPARVRLALETRRDPAPGVGDRIAANRVTVNRISANRISADTDQLEMIEEYLQKLDLTVTGVPLEEALFTRLGKVGEKAKRLLSPTGIVEIGYKFTRGTSGWKREYDIRPQSVAVTYEKFRYPVVEVQGSVKKTVTSAEGVHTVIDLRGKAAGQPVTLNGKITGDWPDPAIRLRLAGINLPLDDALIAALPGKYPDLIRQFHAVGRADLTAKIVAQSGVNSVDNEFRIELRDTQVKYSRFPLLLKQVKGRIVLRSTTTDETRPATLLKSGEPISVPDDELILDGFTGTHGGATFWLNGTQRSVPGTIDRNLILHVGSTRCSVDAELKAALAGLKLTDLWSAFSPRGEINFVADLEILDRRSAPASHRPDPPFDPAADLKLTFHFSGPTITPSFFPYQVDDVTGWLKYQSGRVDLAHFSGRHGESRMKLSAGDVRFYPNGVIWANLGGLELNPLVADEVLLKALPGKLRSAFGALQLKGPSEVNVKQMVVLTPPDAAAIVPPPEPAPMSNGTQHRERTPRGMSSVRGQAPEEAVPPAPLRFPAPSPVPPPRPDPIVYWDAELKLAGASITTGVSWENLFGAVACRGRYEGTHLGLVRGNVFLDRGTIAQQPVSNAMARIHSAPQVPNPAEPGQFFPPELEFTGISGAMFQGAVGGEARVRLEETVRYDVWLTANDVRLEEVARQHRLASDADLKGIAQAQLRLYNRRDPTTGEWAVEGLGKLDVPTGRMYNLPIMLDLVKVLKLQAPDKTAFEEAHATFHVHGNRITIDQLDLIGKAICVGGSGELDTNGEYVKFEFYTLYSEILARLVNTPVGDVTAFVSRGLFKIKMTRENGVTKYKPEPVPIVTEPIKAITNRLKNRFGKLMGK